MFLILCFLFTASYAHTVHMNGHVRCVYYKLFFLNTITHLCSFSLKNLHYICLNIVLIALEFNRWNIGHPLIKMIYACGD